jgi:hypothetical protein
LYPDFCNSRNLSTANRLFLSPIDGMMMKEKKRRRGEKKRKRQQKFHRGNEKTNKRREMTRRGVKKEQMMEELGKVGVRKAGRARYKLPFLRWKAALPCFVLLRCARFQPS